LACQIVGHERPIDIQTFYVCLEFGWTKIGTLTRQRFFLKKTKTRQTACSFGWWLMASERKVLLPDCWWLVCSLRKILLAGG
jgi:hypothetical protein